MNKNLPFMYKSRIWILHENGIEYSRYDGLRRLCKGNLEIVKVDGAGISLKEVEEVFGTLKHRELWN